jgi:hypothetical protein
LALRVHKAFKVLLVHKVWWERRAHKESKVRKVLLVYKERRDVKGLMEYKVHKGDKELKV